MYIGLHVQYALFASDFNENSIFSTDYFDKSSNTTFHKNPPSDTRVVPRGQTNTHDEENTRFSQFSNATKNISSINWS